MQRRLIFPIVLGLGGIALLVSLGNWQVARMQWKNALLADINARLVGEAIPVPAAPTPEADKYRPVTAKGQFTGETLYVISGMKDIGAGVQVISVLASDDGRRLLVDRGFLPDQDKSKPLTTTDITVTGNLHWPEEVTTSTPPPDSKTGLWFARDVPAMAATLGTENLLIVASRDTGDAITPRRVDTSAIPNDHWGYAITWFSLALVWAVMTLALIWRITARKE